MTVLEIGEGQCCAGGIADLAGAEGGVLECPPVAGKQGEPAFTQEARDRWRALRVRVPVMARTGPGSAERDGLVTRMIEYAIRDCAAEAVKAQVTPDSSDPAPLWTLAWRSRSAAWMIRHRALLENAITG